MSRSEYGNVVKASLCSNSMKDNCTFSMEPVLVPPSSVILSVFLIILCVSPPSGIDGIGLDGIPHYIVVTLSTYDSIPFSMSALFSIVSQNFFHFT